MFGKFCKKKKTENTAKTDASKQIGDNSIFPVKLEKPITETDRIRKQIFGKPKKDSILHLEASAVGYGLEKFRLFIYSWKIFFIEITKH